MSQSQVEQFVDRLPREQLFFGGLLAVAGYMFLAAQQFPAEARLFPQLAAGTVLIAGGLRLLNRVLPVEVSRSDSVMLSNETADNEEDVETDSRDMLALAGLVTVYILGGYVVGLFWLTPVFVLGYTLWTRQPWWAVVGLTVGLTGVAYGFMTIMNLDLMSGGF